MKTIFLYAGQGSQFVGMGKDLYEAYPEFREVVDEMENKLPFSAKELMWNGPEEKLMQTQHTQPCMAIFAAGVTAVLKKRGIKADAACGLSLGEYGALYGAGVWSAEDYVQTTAYRGKVMAEAVEGLATSMSAVLGLDAKKTEEACKIAAEQSGGFVTVANYNCPGQYVICGEETAVAAAEQAATSLGAKRCIRLKVSAPFHTKYLQSAGDQLKEYLDQITFQKPEIPVAMNVTGVLLEDAENAEHLKDLLRLQVSNSVRFEDDIKTLLNEYGGTNEDGGVSENDSAAGENLTFIEIGPGNALSGFVKKTAAALKMKPQIFSIQNVKDIEKVEQHYE